MCVCVCVSDCKPLAPVTSTFLSTAPVSVGSNLVCQDARRRERERERERNISIKDEDSIRL